MKFGNESQINSITIDVGGAVGATPVEAQTELFHALIDGCTEAVELGSSDPKGPLLDFIRVPVKANELITRVKANALLEQELAAVDVKNAYCKVGRKASKKEREHLVDISFSRGQEKKEKLGSYKVDVQMRKGRLQKHLKVEPVVKEEGEMSNDDEVYEQFMEVKWMEWCQEVMVEEMKTLKRLHRLQTTRANLPKEKVLSKIRSYLQLLGRRIDQIVSEHEEGPYKQDRMTTRLWKYVSTFSHLSGERLDQIHSKLKLEKNAEGFGPSHADGSVSGPFNRNGNHNYSYSFPRHMERQGGYKNVTTYQMPEPTNNNTDM